MISIKNTKINDKIDSLWVMGGAKSLKDKVTNEISAYLCYCDICKKMSVSGEGGIAFQTAEDLLVHRKMKAFMCPSGCGIHVCEERGSIIRHLKTFHTEVLTKLENEGLDQKKSWIYPDNSNNSYTLTKPMPIFDDRSPMEAAGHILSITEPKRVEVPLSAAKATKFPLVLNKSDIIKADTKKAPWAGKERTNTSFSAIIKEQEQMHTEPRDNTTRHPHYAQEDMRKEKQCFEGKACVKKDRPFACAFNHDGNGDIIKYGTLLTENILCTFERPPFMRCGNGKCTHVHLEGRNDFIQNKKKQFFDNPQSANYETIDIKKNQGIYIPTSKKTMKDISEIVKRLVDQQSDDDEFEGERVKMGEDTPNVSTDEDEDEDDDDDIPDQKLASHIAACIASRVAIM